MQHFITPANAPPFPEIDCGEGVYLWDRAGKRYLDGSSGAVVCNIGHGNARVKAALLKQVDRVSFAYGRVWESEANEDMAARLVRMADWGYGACFFVSGGTEAVEAALKLARQLSVARGRPDRWKVISRAPSYHGSTLAVLGVTGDPDFGGPFAPMFVMHPKVPAPLSYRPAAGMDAEAYATHCARELERRIAEEGEDTVLAFIMEPVGGVSTGALVAPDAYYREIRQICDRHGVLLIFDEVMSGAGRTGKFLAAHHWRECRPDIVVLAKGLSGGYAPLGAVMTTGEIVDEVRAMGGFLHGHTYAANPLACAVGAAVLDELERRELIARAAAMGERLQMRLKEVQARRDCIGDVRGRGLLCAAEIVADRATKRIFPAEAGAMDKLRALAMEEGLMLLSRRTSGGRFGEWLMACPPLIVSEEEVDMFAEMLDCALKRFEDWAAREGFV
ncbi:MAG: aspartate aminotransferase family protein [Alphaproteobacteria bacterium]|nr:MAG: aspartate aminotransferase family protein [Alphaproteobacteria bacterium]